MISAQIEKKRLSELREWFSRYVSGFQTEDPEFRHALDLKKAHTSRVCQEIVCLGMALGLNENELRLAEITALFHDVGRFEQFVRYGTFVDYKSENHADLGVDIISRQGVLNCFQSAAREIILKAIGYHNVAALPVDETAVCLFFAKLLRDADKLDIWRVVTDYYRKKGGRRNGAIELDLPDTPGFSHRVYDDLMNRSIVDMTHVRNLNDFKLLQLGWVFDINFAPTFSRIQSRNYIERIGEALPKCPEIENLIRMLQQYMESRIDTTIIILSEALPAE